MIRIFIIGMVGAVIFGIAQGISRESGISPGWKAIAWCVAILLFAPVAIYLNPFAERTPQRSEMVEAYAVQAEIESTLKGILKDPASAQFRGFFFGEYEGGAVGCGEVNSRNSFGAMTGHKRYVSAGPDHIELEGETAGFSAAWQGMCRPFEHRR